MPTIYVQPASAFPAVFCDKEDGVTPSTAAVSALYLPRGMLFSTELKSDGITRSGNKWGIYTATLRHDVFASDDGPEWHTALSDRSMAVGLHAWEIVIPGAEEELPHTGNEVVTGIAHANANMKACLGSPQSGWTAGLRVNKKYFAPVGDLYDDEPFAELLVSMGDKSLVLTVPGIKHESKEQDEATRLHFTLDITAGTLEVQVDFAEPVLLLGPLPGAVHTTSAIKMGKPLFAGMASTVYNESTFELSSR